MIEHLRRKNLTESAEAAVEVGRLLYLLGRHGEGLQKFDEAIEADGDRDQTYIDVVAFLVQHGETDAALSVYHRALSRPGPRGLRVREGLHLAVGAGPVAPHEQDRPTRRPRRSCARSTAATATCARAAAPPGITCSRATPSAQLTYEQMLAAADTTGKRAEIYFYEGMRRLADGKSDDAHAALAEGGRHAHVLVLRVRHGVALPARRRPHHPPDACLPTLVPRRDDQPGPIAPPPNVDVDVVVAWTWSWTWTWTGRSRRR